MENIRDNANAQAAEAASDLRDRTAIFIDTHRIIKALSRALDTNEELQICGATDFLGAEMLIGGAGNDTVKAVVSKWCEENNLHLLEVDCTAIRLKTDRHDKEEMLIPGQIIKWPKSMIEGLEIPRTVLYLEGYDRAEPTIRGTLRDLTYDHKLFAPHEEHQKRSFNNLLMTIAAVDDPIYNRDPHDFNGFTRIYVSKLAFTADVLNHNNTGYKLTPSMCITEMLRHIGTDGMLYIPKWPHGDAIDCSNTSVYACSMNLDKVRNNRGMAEQKLDALMDDFKIIAGKYDELGDSLEENTALLGEKTARIWDKFIRPFKAQEQFDMEVICDIQERLDAYAYEENEEDCSSLEVDSLTDSDYSLSDEEKALYDSYANALDEEAKERIKGDVCSYDVLIRSMRACRLMSLEAPDIVIQSEAIFLAQALVLNMYCSKMETVELQ